MSDLGELRWMLPPLAMCLVLVGIHGYLGIHVLLRKVIFVDLALAQIAALGSIYAVLLGYDPHDDAAVVYLVSLGFTFVGAALFSLTRMRHEKVPHEAFIGIVYATASATALLLLAKASGEAEHIKEMLVGNVLLVTWPAIGKTAAIYGALGLFHWIFRKPFLEISTDPEAAEAAGRNVRLWDFFFYASFGLVITISVAVAGVLLVFSFLVVPAVIAFMFMERTGGRIALAWTVSTLCSAAGMLLSYYGDLPTGPSVVACFAGLLLVASLFYFIRAADHRPAALAKVLLGLALVAGVLAAGTKLRKAAPTHTHGSELSALLAQLETGDENAQIEAVHHLALLKDAHAVDALAAALGPDRSERVVEHIVQVLPDFGPDGARAAPALEAVADKLEDPFVRLEVAETLLRLRRPSGFAVLAKVLAEDPPLLVEQKAGKLLQEMAGKSFGLSSDDRAVREQGVVEFAKWLEGNRDHLKWRPDRERFE